MKIGYPCINRSIDCTANTTFRLKNLSSERFIETVRRNLECLHTILKWNDEHDIRFFRISSDIIPFAGHPELTVDWMAIFKTELKAIGRYIGAHGMRVAMHPDQFVLLNAQSESIINNSIAELLYHADFLDSLGVDRSAKIQIHVGGVYGDKDAAIRRFIAVYDSLPGAIHNRLVVENDERLYCLADCLAIHASTKIPIVCDVFHHAIHNHGEPVGDAVRAARETWRSRDGAPIVDYSSQAAGSRIGAHAESIDVRDFAAFMMQTRAIDFDCMLEIKDKERSALKALRIAGNLNTKQGGM
jgi:UV DNA damage endonuclease